MTYSIGEVKLIFTKEKIEKQIALLQNALDCMNHKCEYYRNLFPLKKFNCHK
jgi:hypothetical protein